MPWFIKLQIIKAWVSKLLCHHDLIYSHQINGQYCQQCQICGKIWKRQKTGGL